ncbi:MAG: CRTAC1 family protein [Pseudomonadales bacterium]|nr:CRTAC1 family protein [Pseudomonadales bacterium]MDP6473004.1 CRTAC1 family protein [Pseudomonadales bacterium]
MLTYALEFEDVSLRAGVHRKAPTAASAWGDVNANGWPDLWVSNHHGEIPSLYLNRGDATFEDVVMARLPHLAAGAVPDYYGAAWVDFDGDGDTDWLLARARPYAQEVRQTGPAEVRARINARKDGTSASFSLSTSGDLTLNLHRVWIDPSDPERTLFPVLQLGRRQTALDGRSVVLHASDSTLHEPADGPTDAREWFGVWFDAAKQRWHFDSTVTALGIVVTSTVDITEVQTSGFKSSHGALQDFLLTANGGEFRAVPLLEQPTPCHSITAGDFDNDGDLDLYMVCATPTGNAGNMLLVNDGRGHFTPRRSSGGGENGRANQVSAADYDQDGFLDLFVTNGGGQPPFANQGRHQLLRNVGNSNHWLEIDLVGGVSNPHGLGATVIVRTGKTLQRRLAGGSVHAFSQDHQRLHFGLGPNERVDEVTVSWPSGGVQMLNHVAADQILCIEEG